MKIFLVGDSAFVELAKEHNYMLCIGTKADVDKATPPELIHMVDTAIAFAKYRGLTGKEVKH